MKKLCNYYRVYEEDKLVAEGFKSDVAWTLGITESGVDTMCRQQALVKGKYLIKFIDKKVKHYSRIGDPIVSRSRKETFVERYWDLNRYGFTEMSEEEYKRHHELIESKGYRARYTKIPIGRRKHAWRVDLI